MSKPSYWTKRRRVNNEVNRMLSEAAEKHIIVEPFANIQSQVLQPPVASVAAYIPLNECYSNAGHCNSDNDSVRNDESTSTCESDADEFESDCSSESDDFYDTDNLRNGLVQWALLFSISHSALGALLVLLRSFFPGLPKDPRTLLGTKTNVAIVPRAGGSYCHFGIKENLLNRFSSLPIPSSDTISIKVNIDGLPLFKSSNAQVWPILGLIDNVSQHHEPIIIGIFSGSSKPTPVNDYLQDFVREVKDLYEHGLYISERHYSFKISSFICDTPARALIKLSKGHNGYGGCDKCVQKGVHNGRITFPITDAELRTDESFKDMSDERHHIGCSILTSLPIGMVSQFPVDYMHLVCLGVVRKLVSLWTKGPLKTRLGPAVITKISDFLINLKPNVVTEFARKPRSLSEFERWKATEFRQFLLYTGVVSLYDSLPKAFYDNFMLLSVSITILLSKQLHVKYLTYAQSLLKSFVLHFSQLYGSDMLTYNVHGLIHLCDECKQYGPLDNISAFPFENYLGQLKKLVRKPNFPLQQVVRRLSEKQIETVEQKSVFPILKQEHVRKSTVKITGIQKQYKQIQLQYYVISIESNDNCVRLHSGEIVIVENILKTSEDILLVCRQFEYVDDFFSYPCKSSQVGICAVKNLSLVARTCSLNDIQSKCVLLPAKDCKIVFPLLHC